MKANKEKQANDEVRLKDQGSMSMSPTNAESMAAAADDGNTPVLSEESEGERPGREQSEYED